MSLFSFRADPALHVGMSEINLFFLSETTIIEVGYVHIMVI